MTPCAGWGRAPDAWDSTSRGWAQACSRERASDISSASWEEVWHMLGRGIRARPKGGKDGDGQTPEDQRGACRDKETKTKTKTWLTEDLKDPDSALQAPVAAACADIKANLDKWGYQRSSGTGVILLS
ncbi:hypothetical protein CRUP_008362 [Coryphaenoides rupestris]|nr:hypothetical protein CRUP_008362 [Coryphaenoides rupestris]